MRHFLCNPQIRKAAIPVHNPHEKDGFRYDYEEIFSDPCCYDPDWLAGQLQRCADNDNH